jgi:hypothetical protein
VHEGIYAALRRSVGPDISDQSFGDVLDPFGFGWAQLRMTGKLSCYLRLWGEQFCANGLKTLYQ